jgi:hypothetical protein
VPDYRRYPSKQSGFDRLLIGAVAIGVIGVVAWAIFA